MPREQIPKARASVKLCASANSADRKHGHPPPGTETEVRHHQLHVPGSNFFDATFENVRMREADLTGARLDGATVRGTVDLSGAWLHSAKLSGCDLRGSDLSSVDPLTVELNRTIIDIDQAVTLAVALGLDARPE